MTFTDAQGTPNGSQDNWDTSVESLREELNVINTKIHNGDFGPIDRGDLMVASIFGYMNSSTEILKSIAGTPGIDLSSTATNPTQIGAALLQITEAIRNREIDQIKNREQRMRLEHELRILEQNSDMIREVAIAQLTFDRDSQRRMNESAALKSQTEAAVEENRRKIAVNEGEIGSNNHQIAVLQQAVARIEAEQEKAHAEGNAKLKQKIAREKLELQDQIEGLTNKNELAQSIVDASKVELVKQTALIEQIETEAQLDQRRLRSTLERSVADATTTRRFEVEFTNLDTQLFLSEQDALARKELAVQEATLARDLIELEYETRAHHARMRSLKLKTDAEIDRFNEEIRARSERAQMELITLETDIKTRESRRQHELNELVRNGEHRSKVQETKRAYAKDAAQRWWKHNGKKVRRTTLAVVAVTTFANFAEDNPEFQGTVPGMDVINGVSDKVTEPITEGVRKLYRDFVVDR
jgi:hypothetical protein